MVNGIGSVSAAWSKLLPHWPVVAEAKVPAPKKKSSMFCSTGLSNTGQSKTARVRSPNSQTIRFPVMSDAAAQRVWL